MAHSIYYARSTLSEGKRLTNSISLKWQKPNAGWQKLNTNGASLLQDGGMGFIIRNHLGDCQAEGQQYIQGKSDDHAIKIGLKVAISRKITHLTLESDSSSIVDLLNKDKTVP